jgi:thioredoxin-dependent peroxiredoxin
MLELGQEAPDFELPSSEMRMVRLSEFRGNKQVVLYFYPKDDTPGCTIESQEFSDLQDEFEKLDTVVIGISRDNCMSHGEFRDKYGLTVQLLADVEGVACKDYGVLQQREKDGVMKEVAVRATFIIDKDGILELALYDVAPRGHAQDILDILSES